MKNLPKPRFIPVLSVASGIDNTILLNDNLATVWDSLQQLWNGWIWCTCYMIRISFASCWPCHDPARKLEHQAHAAPCDSSSTRQALSIALHTSRGCWQLPTQLTEGLPQCYRIQALQTKGDTLWNKHPLWNSKIGKIFVNDEIWTQVKWQLSVSIIIKQSTSVSCW